MVQDMLDSGYACIMRATNATEPDLLRQIAQNVTTDAGVSCGPTIYQSTGIQSQPLCDAIQFKEIIGRSPLAAEIGTAAIGRYERVGGASTYEHEYGTPFLAARVNSNRSELVDSSFQTEVYGETVRRITKAKVKASMMAGRYRKVAEEAGFRVLAEAKLEKVIHSEQYPALMTFDAEGNTEDGHLGALFLPNIYGEEITPKTPQNLSVSLGSDDTSNQCSLQSAIASLKPSLRKDVPNPEPLEDYGGPMNGTRRGSSISSMEFVVYDPASSPTPTTPTAMTMGLTSSKKRKLNAIDRSSTTQPSCKRSKWSSSPTQIVDQGQQTALQNSMEENFETKHLRQNKCEDIRGRALHKAHEITFHLEPAGRPDLHTIDIPKCAQKGHVMIANVDSHTLRQMGQSSRAHGRARPPNSRSRSPEARDYQTYRSRDSNLPRSDQKAGPGRNDNRTRREYDETDGILKRTSPSSLSTKPSSDARHAQAQTCHDKRAAVMESMADVNRTPKIVIGCEDSLEISAGATVKINEQAKHHHQSAPQDKGTATSSEKCPSKLSVKVVPDEKEVTSVKTGSGEAKSSSKDHGHEVERQQLPKSYRENATHTPRHITREILKAEQESAVREVKDFKVPANAVNKVEDAMTQARRTADRRRALANSNTEPARTQRVQTEIKSSSRVEKSYKKPLEHGSKRETSERLNNEKEKKAPATTERKPPTGPRPRRDARSLINRWLGA